MKIKSIFVKDIWIYTNVKPKRMEPLQQEGIISSELYFSKRLKISTDITKALESKIVSKVRLVELLPKARILLLMKLTRNQKFEPAKNTVENVVQIGPKKRPT